MLGIFELAILIFIVIYIFNKNSAINVLDNLQTRMWEAWRNDQPADVLYNTNTVRTVNEQIRRDQVLRKEREKKALDGDLFLIKEQAPSIVYPTTRTVTTRTCQNCSLSSGKEFLDHFQRRRNVDNILSTPKTRFLGETWNWNTLFPIVSWIAKLKCYEYAQVGPTVISEERMQSAIHQAARESHIFPNHMDEAAVNEDLVKKHSQRAWRLLQELQSSISDRFLKFACFLVYKLVPCFLSGVIAHPSQIDMLKAINKKSEDVPLIFLPLHRSHLDYILVTFILLNNNMRAPIVAAGNNLNIPFFGSLLRHAGAFFIKRRIDPVGGKKDVVYRSLLHTYLQKSLSKGHHIEFFIEGGRTRTGKPCMPKSGILSVIIDACMDGTIPDALLVPVSVNYEKLVDGNFVNEQLGQRKTPESFVSALLSVWKTLNSQYGQMRIDFKEPFSLRELVKSLNAKIESERVNGSHRLLQHTASTSSLYGTDVVREEHRNLVDSIAKHVVYDCTDATSIMTTNALAFLLLSHFREGATLDVLVQALDKLRNDLRDKRDVGFTGSSREVVLYAAKLLGPELVDLRTSEAETVLKPVTVIPNVIELFYYANTLNPFFALDAAVVTAATILYKKQNSTEDSGVAERDLLNCTQEMCDILRYEFIFTKPCQDKESVVNDSIFKLTCQHILHKTEVEQTDDEIQANRIANYLKNNGDFDEDSTDEEVALYRSELDRPKIFLVAETRHEREILIRVLAPFMHTYLAVAQSMTHLIGGIAVVEAEFIKMCVAEIKRRVEQKQCIYGESISTDTIRNSIKLLEKWNVLIVSVVAGARLLSLNHMYDSVTGVKNIIDRIKKFTL